MAPAPAVSHPVLKVWKILVVRIVDLIAKDTSSDLRSHRPGSFIRDCETGCYADPGVRLMWHVAHHVAPLLRLLDHHIDAPLSRSNEGSVEPQKEIQAGALAIMRSAKRVIFVFPLEWLIINLSLIIPMVCGWMRLLTAFCRDAGLISVLKTKHNPASVN